MIQITEIKIEEYISQNIFIKEFITNQVRIEDSN
jgi:hypothetical protein